jgi:hypothetical protein
MAVVSDDEVLLLWRALNAFRSGRRPACAPRARHETSRCPLAASCPRWHGPDDYELSLNEPVDETEERRAAWPCSRLLDVLGAEAHSIE